MILEKREAKDMIKFVAAFVVAYLILAGGFSILANLAGAQEIQPIEPPTLQAKTIHTLTADERSEILIYDIWRKPGLERVKTGAAFDSVKTALIEPVGWLAYVSQDAVVDAPGVAYAYGEM